MGFVKSTFPHYLLWKRVRVVGVRIKMAKNVIISPSPSGLHSLPLCPNEPSYLEVLVREHLVIASQALPELSVIYASIQRASFWGCITTKRVTEIRNR